MLWIESIESPKLEVTGKKARRTSKEGPEQNFERRVLERAYYLFENGEGEDADRNYFAALKIELRIALNSSG